MERCGRGNFKEAVKGRQLTRCASSPRKNGKAWCTERQIPLREDRLVQGDLPPDRNAAKFIRSISEATGL